MGGRALYVETANPASQTTGTSKGKAIDPREWGAAGLTEEDLDEAAQCAAFDSWNVVKAAAEVVGSAQSGSGTEKAMDAAVSIEISK